MSEACTHPFYVRNSLGRYVLASSDQVMQVARFLANEKLPLGTAIVSPSDITDFLRTKFVGLEREVFYVVFLSAGHKIIHHTEMFYGTIDRNNIYPREILKEALKHNAAAIVLAHNRPSGNATPSEGDMALNLRIKECMRVVDIRVLDHFVIGGETYASMAEAGMM